MMTDGPVPGQPGTSRREITAIRGMLLYLIAESEQQRLPWTADTLRSALGALDAESTVDVLPRGGSAPGQP